MAAWRDLALHMPIIRRWYERAEETFTVDDIVLEAPSPAVSRSVRKSLRRNNYENAEAYLVRQLVRPGDSVLDLGSGLGLTSIAAAKASRGGRVVGYEANPAIALLAERNVRRNAVQVDIRNRAIAKERGVCQFHVRRSFPASSLFATRGSKTIQIETDGAQEVVDEIQPDVIACDIEGVEKDVLVHTRLEPVQRLIVEVHPQIIGLLGVAECIQTLAVSGFRLVESLCFEQVLVFDRDGSFSTIEPFRSHRQEGRKGSA